MGTVIAQGGYFVVAHGSAASGTPPRGRADARRAVALAAPRGAEERAHGTERSEARASARRAEGTRPRRRGGAAAGSEKDG